MVEVVWKGKYDEAGRRIAPLKVQLPLQTIETVNESTQERQRRLERFVIGREDSEWRNRLIWGDKKYVLPSLLTEFAGKVDLIYIDPPFDTGADFSYTATVPSDPKALDEDRLAFTKEPSVIEQKAYRDTWGRGLDTYLQWFYETMVLLHDLLSDAGSMYVHLDWHVNSAARLILEEIFGSNNLDTEIIWKRKDAQSFVDTYGMLHDTIYFLRKGEDFTFNKQYVALSQETADAWYTNEERVEIDFTNSKGHLIPSGTIRRYNNADISAPGPRPGTEAHYQWKGHWPPPGRHWAYRNEVMQKLESDGRLTYSKSGRVYEKRYLDESAGIPGQSIWTDVSFVRGMSKHKAHSEWLDYPTQKPEALLERIIRASSNEEDLVLDCFVGSGTTAAVAEKLGRRWVACDLSRFAVHTTRKRLLGIPGVKPFIVQNLGKYERQAWQAAEFGSESETRVRSYIDFILKLFAAQPLRGSAWLHGKKGNRFLHVGSVDSPVSPLDIGQIVAEFKRSLGSGKDAPKTNGIDVLGWDFAFELNELAKQQASQANVDLRFLRIPREVLDKKAVEQGDVHFFELASLDVATRTSGKKVSIAIRDFIIPPDDVPSDIQKQVTHWSQWIDYWAIDWDNKNDTFHNEWQEYRSREKPKLETESSKTYDEHGEHRIVVKVIDILGNDTTKMLTVKV